MSKYEVGDKVKHGFSQEEGVITSVIKYSKYKYFVTWKDSKFNDWFEEKVLVRL